MRQSERTVRQLTWLIQMLSQVECLPQPESILLAWWTLMQASESPLSTRTTLVSSSVVDRPTFKSLKSHPCCLPSITSKVSPSLSSIESWTHGTITSATLSGSTASSSKQLSLESPITFTSRQARHIHTSLASKAGADRSLTMMSSRTRASVRPSMCRYPRSEHLLSVGSMRPSVRAMPRKLELRTMAKLWSLAEAFSGCRAMTVHLKRLKRSRVLSLQIVLRKPLLLQVIEISKPLQRRTTPPRSKSTISRRMSNLQPNLSLM